MPIATFHDLCAGLCQGLGPVPPHLGPGASAGDGPAVLQLSIDGVNVAIAPALLPGDEAGATLSVEYGAVPPAREASVLEALMDANLRMMGAHAPAFVRDTQGCIQLLASWPLAGLELHETRELLKDMASAALAWRRDAEDPPAAPPQGYA